jgi:hypothetical protein
MLRERLNNKLNDAKQVLENYVLQGNVQDFASYRFLVGQIKGLQDAIDIYKDTFKKRNDD